MIRPLTLISAAMFACSGAYLFAVKQHSQVLEDKLAQVAQATRLDEQRVVVLQAQWALEVDPSRLQQLSANFTTLQPMKPSQMVALSHLAEMLPAPNSPVPESSLAAPAVPPPANVDAGAVAQIAPAPAASQAGSQMHLASAEQAAPPQEPPAEIAPLGAQVHLVSAELVQPPADFVRPVRPAPVYEAVHRSRAREAVPHKRLVHPVLRRQMPARHNAESHIYMARSTYVTPVPEEAPMGAPVLPPRRVAESTPPLPPSMADGGGSMLGMAQSPGSD